MEEANNMLIARVVDAYKRAGISENASNVEAEKQFSGRQARER